MDEVCKKIHERVDEEMVLSHTALLATIDARSKSNTKRLDSLDRLVGSIHELTIGFTKLVVNVEQQSKDLTIMVRTLESHKSKIESIEDKMETKDTVSRLHGRVEEMKQLMDDREQRQREQKLKEYEDMKKFVVKTLIGAAVFVIGAVTIFGAIVLSALANNGTLPMP